MMRSFSSRGWFRSVGLMFVGALATLVLPGVARGQADYGVRCISGNNPTSCAIGTAQINVNVSQPAPGVARFTISNTGASACSIRNVYFDGAPEAGLRNGRLVTTAGVRFAAGGSPGNLPAGNSISPSFQSDVRWSANNPGPTNGVNPGESLIVEFDLAPGVAFADLLSDLRDGTLRVGMHVIAFANGSSESFVTRPRCPADLNGDGVVDDRDFQLFLQWYAAGDPRADLDDGTFTGTRDGGVTIDDLKYYRRIFMTPCP